MAVVLAGIGILFRMREKEREADRVRLQTELDRERPLERVRLQAELDRERTERARERAEYREGLEKLGAKLDAERADKADVIQRVAVAFVQRSTIEQLRSFDDLKDMPTGIRPAMLVAKAAVTDPLPHLKGWDPNERTPR